MFCQKSFQKVFQYLPGLMTLTFHILLCIFAEPFQTLSIIFSSKDLFFPWAEWHLNWCKQIAFSVHRTVREICLFLMFAIGFPFFKHKIAHFKGWKQERMHSQVSLSYSMTMNAQTPNTSSHSVLRYLFLLNAYFCFLDLKASGVTIQGTQPPHCTRPAPIDTSIVLLVS